MNKIDLDEEQLQEVVLGTNAETVYQCKYCMKPTGYTSVEDAYLHIKRCVYNKDNKSCIMCKHLKLMEQAPLPRLSNDYLDVDINYAIGDFNFGVCQLTNEVLDTERILHGCDDWEFEDEPVLVEKTKDRIEWENTVEKISVEEKKQNEELLKEHLINDHKVKGEK